MSTTVRRRLARLALIMTPAALAGGCYSPGGTWMSVDAYCYESHSFQPWTVSVIDTRTRQAVFSIDVPVGQELVMKFSEDDGDTVEPGDKPSPIYPDMLRWDLWPIGQRLGEPQRQVVVPARQHRLLDTKLRKIPELPPEMTGESGAAPVTPPTSTRRPEEPD